MKINFTYFGFAVILAGIISCGDPAPTELYEENASPNKNVQVEILSREPGIFIYTNGYDSTGIIDQFINKSAIICVSGIRNTNYGMRAKEEYYHAQFNDKTNPVYLPGGKMLAYKTKNIGLVRFNNFAAISSVHSMRFKDNLGMIKDITLGFKYILNSKMMHGMGISNFPYNSKVNFKLESGRNTLIQFDIPTPAEIIGKVKLSGSLAGKNLKMDLEWSGKGEGKIEIVLGIPITSESFSEQIMPLLKLVGPDNGQMHVPQNILENIPLSQNKTLIVTFIRKIFKEIPFNDILNDSYIVAQSIHNIKVQISR